MAITTLMNERAGLAFGAIAQIHNSLDKLAALAGEVRVNGGSAAEDAYFRQRIAQLHIEAETMRLNAYRGLTKTMQSGIPGPEGSLGKWQWADINQGIAELALDIEGAYAPLARGAEHAIANGAWQYSFLRSRANSIEGGTTDILKNIIAERVLGLPQAALILHRAMYFDLTDEQQAIRVDRPRLPRRPLQTRSGCASWSRASADSNPPTGRRWPSWAGPAWRCPRSGAGRGSASSSWPSCSRRWATRWPPRRSSPTRSPAWPSPSAAPIEQRERWLRPLAAGRGAARRRSGTPARPPTPGGFAMEARPDGDGVVLDGEKDPGAGRGRRRLLPGRNRGRQAPPGRAPAPTG